MLFKSSDFIVKFIDVNKADFHDLKLKNVTSARKLHSFAEYLKRTGGGNLRIQKFSLENSPICKDYFTDVIRVLGHIRTLTTLHLIQMDGVATHIHAIKDAFKKHPNLKELDLSNNGIEDFSELAELIKANTHLQTLNISRNPIDGDQIDNMMDALNDNFHLLELIHDEPLKLSKSSGSGNSSHTISRNSVLEQGKHELELNKAIFQKIIPVNAFKKVLPSRKLVTQSKMKELNLAGVKIE